MGFISVDEIKKRKGARRGRLSKFKFLALSFSRVGVDNKNKKQMNYDGRLCLYFTNEMLGLAKWSKGDKIQLQYDPIGKAILLKKLENVMEGAAITGNGRRFTVTYPYYAGQSMPYPKEMIVIDEKQLHLKKEGLLIDLSRIPQNQLEFI